MSSKTLCERCRNSTNFKEDTFVGVNCSDGDISVNFPLGFHISEDENELRKDILLLINVLSHNTDDKKSEFNDDTDYKNFELPIQSYLYIIIDYFNRGYYHEKDIVYETGKSGKINWSKTIKTQKAYIQDNDIFYLDYMTKKKDTNENQIITLIHEYCVYESFEKLGWIFSSFMPKRSRIKFNKKIFMCAIKKKIVGTFNDVNKQLLIHMLAIVESLGNEGPVKNYKYGTNRFEYIWEKLIDKKYGIENKKNFFPKTKWILGEKIYENSTLEPDSIMIVDRKVFVLDAKYYKFGQTKYPGHLPNSSSINKQITYGEYISFNSKFKDEYGNNPVVFNAFIMPYDSKGKAFHTNTELFYIGNAVSEWKISDGTKTYEAVVGILLDVKTLMKNYRNDIYDIYKLADLIEDKVK